MLKLVFGLILLMSLPIVGMTEEPAAPVEAVPAAAAAPVAPAATPEVVQPITAPAAPAVEAPKKAFPPGYLPWKAPEGK